MIKKFFKEPIYDFISNIKINIFDIKPLLLLIPYLFHKYFNGFLFSYSQQTYIGKTTHLYLRLFVAFLTLEIPKILP